MENYYDMMIQQLLASGSPEYGGDQGRRTAGADASMIEDAMLRYQLGSKRKKGEKENLPSGTYAAADYPGLSYDIWNASTGNNPRGGMAGAIIPGSEEDLWLQELRKKWAANQQKMMPQGNFVSRMGGI